GHHDRAPRHAAEEVLERVSSDELLAHRRMLDAAQVGEPREGLPKGWISGQCGEVAEDILVGEHTPSPTEHETSRDVDPVGCRHHRLPRATEWPAAALGAEVAWTIVQWPRIARSARLRGSSSYRTPNVPARPSRLPRC